MNARFRGLFALAFVLGSACGSDDKRSPVQTSDSAVAANPGTDAGTGPIVGPDSAVPVVDAAVPSNPELDASTLPELDAGSLLDAETVDVTLAPAADAAVPATPHPLAGRYAVRTVSYARQKTTVSGQTIDLVSKGVLLSVADISPAGLVTEHLCLIELYNADGIATWSSPAGTEKVDDSRVLLERRGDVFVRPLEQDRTNVAWSNANRPADCTPAGGAHASGCTCVPGDALPTTPGDCRVRDLDGDSNPGLKLSLGATRPADLSMAESIGSIQVAGVKAVEWRLPLTASASGTLIGKVAGEVDQAQLSAQGELAAELGQVQNSNCPSDTGHVELVPSAFDCAQLLNARRTNVDSYGIFDPNQDARAPEASACPDPSCAYDSDKDGTRDCMDECPADAAKTAKGTCNCGTADTDSDGDKAPDCVDECDADPNKTAAGFCMCGSAETNADGDSLPDCTDECDADPNKTEKGVCDCGTPETNSDDDSAPDCTDECDADPNKTTKGACECGVPNTDTDADGTPDCNDPCSNDPNKTQPEICNCGVRDADLNGDGIVDCTDACPNDPAKVAPGVCNCGVADTDRDSDGTADCNDRCPDERTLTAPGQCGCTPCPTAPSIAPGTYAVRTSIYAKARRGSTISTSKGLGYGLVTIAANSDGTLTLTEQGCANETVPQQGSDGYGWMTPEWTQRLPPSVRRLSQTADGKWQGTTALANTGWDPARHPSACSTSSTPPSGWDSDWGATCVCRGSADALPAYDRDYSGFDCRLTDPERDGEPGVSVYAAREPPPANLGAPQGLSGTAFVASRGASQWTITPAADGKHWGNAAESGDSQIVGCRGTLACLAGLPETPPQNWTCPAAVNKVQLVQVSGTAATCSSILAQRTSPSLFVTNQDGAWPDDGACPAP